LYRPAVLSNYGINLNRFIRFHHSARHLFYTYLDVQLQSFFVFEIRNSIFEILFLNYLMTEFAFLQRSVASVEDVTPIRQRRMYLQRSVLCCALRQTPYAVLSASKYSQKISTEYFVDIGFLIAFIKKVFF